MNLISLHKFLLWCLQLTIVAAAFALLIIDKPLVINSDITSLFSSNTNNDWQAAQQQIDSRMNTSQLYLVGHSDPRVATNVALALSYNMQNIAGISHVTAKLDQIPNQTLMIDSYSGVEQQLLTAKFRQAIMAKDTESLFKYQFELLTQLGDQLVAKTIDKDPTLAFAQYLNRSPLPKSQLTITPDGFLTVSFQDKTYVLVTIETEQGAFDITSASAIVAALNQLTEPKALLALLASVDSTKSDQAISSELLSKSLSDLSLVRTGAIFYSEEASSTAQWEMQWLGGLSIVAALLLILVTYRRFVMALSTVVLIGISMLYGVVGLMMFFDEINIISLVFAITLIGISADYSFHSLTQLQQTDNNDKAPLDVIKVSLILSFLTTSLGYVLLVIVPIALFKQIAVFTISGLLGALLTVTLAYPYLHQKFNFKEASDNRFYRYLHQQHQRFFYQPKQLLITLLALILIAVFVIQTKGFSDDAKSFYQASESLNLSEQKVKDILGHKFDNQYLLIKADSEQALLEREEAHLDELNQLVANGVIDSYQAVSNWLPSIRQQKINNELLIDANQQGLFNQFKQVIGKEQLSVASINTYLTPELWFSTILGQTQKGLWFSHDIEREDDSKTDTNVNKLNVNNITTYYSVIRFSGIHHLDQLSAAFSSYQHSIFVDKLADTATEIANFRTILFIVFIMACCSALVIFSIRFGFKKACLGIAIPLAAFIIALALSAIIQGALTLFNLAAGLVILALALDYAVFYGEHGFTQSITQTTFMSAVSSVFVFAMLGFSSTPAIASFGQTVFFGIAVAFICSPIITKFNGMKKKGRKSDDFK